jgi:hypothetical protein
MRHVGRATAVIAMLAALVLTPLPATYAAPPQATFAYALTYSNRLLLFNVNAPGTILRNVQVTGLQQGEGLIGIDVRPATGQLYSVGSTGTVYVIDGLSGVATAVAPPTFVLDEVDRFGLDFNPSVDLIRVVNEGAGNVRIVPDTGAIMVDSQLNYAAGDPHAAAFPGISGIAYNNNLPGAAPTTLYDIDIFLDILVIQDPPNAGTLHTVGPLGVDAVAVIGFDIATVGGANTAYATLRKTGETATGLYTIDLVTGAATLIGAIGGGELVRDLTIATGGAACTVPAGTPGVIFVAPGGVPTAGTAGPDVICGTAGVDRISGLGGDDLIVGLGGDDQLTGGDGNDTIYGGAGIDQLIGSGGNDTLSGGEGNDDLSGGAGNDSLFGNAGTDRLVGADGTDTCAGGGDAGDQVALCEP